MKNKKKNFTWSSELTEEAIEFTATELKLALLATIDHRGWPHLTLITYNRAKTNNQIVWGQFTEGLSKKYVIENPKQGILYMNISMPFKFLQIKSDFSHIESEGEDLDYFNKLELMRYMTYVRIYKAYYEKVIAATSLRALPILSIAKGIIKNIIGKGGMKTGFEEKRLDVIGYKIFKGPINPKFISYIDPSDGYPVILPCLQLQAVDHNRLIFPLGSALRDDLKKIPQNSNIAVYGANFDLANQMINGIFTGFKKSRGITFGIIEIKEVYNSSPPLPGVIYPERRVRPKVTNFSL
ncbi:MAG: pyridoxamine 5'-phosphate oxidase family protein [Promethearchaeota archaeon]